MTLSRPPHINETKAPGTIPGERRVSWSQLLDKPSTLTGAGITLTTLFLHDTGNPPLAVERSEAVAAVLPVIAVRRDGHTYGYIGLDANDHLVIIAKDGTTVLADFDTDGTQNYALQLLRNAAAAVLPFLSVKRQAQQVGFIGSDASDRLAFIAQDGTTVLGYMTNAGELDTIDRVKSPHIEGTTDSTSPHLIATTDVKTPKVLDSGGLQVLSARKTGWAVATGSATRTTFDTTTVTTEQLAERVKALIDDLHSTAGHGAIGT